MSSKKYILDKLRSFEPTDQLAPLPDDGPWIEYENRVSQFESMIKAVGGGSVRLGRPGEINEGLKKLPPYNDAIKVCAIGLEIDKANVKLSDIADPHDLEDVDFAVACGQVGVAENGAIWVPGTFDHRCAIFITQHLALLIRAEDIVNNLHEAYRKIDLPQPGYGVFVSGPSKTADIEQSLVIGAHGPRSLTVFIVM